MTTSAGAELAHGEIRDAVAKLCRDFPGEYWRALDRERAYPTAFVETADEGGLSLGPDPRRIRRFGTGARRRDGDSRGDPSLGLQRRRMPRADVHDGRACCGTEARNRRRNICPKIATGDLRLQAFGVTEPTSGTDTTRIRTFARREGDRYIVNGQKIWISRAEHSDLMLLLCRTTPREESKKPTDGMTVLLVDMREAVKSGLTIRPIRTMLNHATTELFFDNMPVPVENLIGEEGKGFRYILDGMNAERILIASECIGDGRFFIERATEYAKTREVFGRPIGQNQGVQFPIARSYVEVEAAALMVEKAARLFEGGRALRHGGQHGQAAGLGSELARR